MILLGGVVQGDLFSPMAMRNSMNLSYENIFCSCDKWWSSVEVVVIGCLSPITQMHTCFSTALSSDPTS